VTVNLAATPEIASAEQQVRLTEYRREEHDAFVRESWRTNSEVDDKLRIDMGELIRAALSSPSIRLVILVDGTWSDLLIGWVAASNDGKVLHFVYVKPQYRKNGFARMLLEAADVVPGKVHLHTFHTRCLKWLKLKTMHFPYALQVTK